MTGTEPDPPLPLDGAPTPGGADPSDRLLPAPDPESRGASELCQTGSQSARGRRRRRVLFLTGGLLLATAALGVLALLLTLHHFERNLPSVEQLRHGYDPPQVTQVLARDGTVVGRIFTERRTVIPIGTLPAHVKLAFLAAEDAYFYEHEGLNYLGMLRALIANLRAGRTRQGGSTITQQVVKNILLEPERTYRRKIRETILARRLEQNLTKDEIFSLYLNHIYFGHRCYGVEEAARYYFGKPARALDLPEAALLAGLVAAPERFSPRHSPERALERRNYVLGQMLDKGFVTRELFQQSLRAPVRLAPAAERESELAPEVVSYAARVLEEVAGERARRGGYTISTTLDPVLQTQARRAVRENLDAYARRHHLLPPLRRGPRPEWGQPFAGEPQPNQIYVGVVEAADDRSATLLVRVGTARGRVDLTAEERYNPNHLLPSQFAEPGALVRVAVLAGQQNGEGPLPLRLELGPQSALVAIDARTHEIRALVGSYEALPGGLDRSVQARRQPGSAFKPFVYSYALHSRRYAPSSVLRLPDAKAEQGERTISLRLALARSDNQAAETLLGELGAERVVEWAHALGIESRLGATPSLALGAYEVTPLELVNAYATLANGGRYAPPLLVTRIVGPDGSELILPPRPPPRSPLQPEEAYLATSLMRSVVELGTARQARVLGRPVAGKTGTTNRARDAWFVGYSTELVAGVWVGYDDGLPLGPGEQGATTALPAWIEFMKRAHSGRPATEFFRPENIERARVDPATGLLAREGQPDAVEEEFLPGTVPTETAPPEPGLPDDAGATDLSQFQPGVPGPAARAGEPAEPEPPGEIPEDGGGAPAARTLSPPG